MAHKTLIGGTAYEIGGGKTLVNGTAYSIDKGKTLVDGTAYEVGFGPAIIEFTVKRPSGITTYQAVEGMNWWTWCDTEYSYDSNISYENGGLVKDGRSYIILNDNFVYANEAIVAAEYESYTPSGPPDW